jgi:2-polyprenyl-3-methyl-5-hydroxy-6-metoxy-1,4-benzoquinol methylase
VDTSTPDNLDALREESRKRWEQIAPFWDDYFGEGNAFQRVLIGPTSERLLDLRPGELVLDVACGNGAFSRRMAQLGAQVVACDFSEQFIERAKQRSAEYADRIEYSVVDATDESQLLALGEGRFDAAVCSMAMMDMATIEPLTSALARLLKPGGRFVFSVMHPCFNNTAMKKVVEEEDRAGELVTVYSVKISGYMGMAPAEGLGIIGQPVSQYYFHRPLSMMFNTCFRAGFVMDALEEPVFGEETQPNRPFSWANYKEIPPVVVARVLLK